MRVRLTSKTIIFSLLAADLLLIASHIIFISLAKRVLPNYTEIIPVSLISVNSDGGIPEMFQYVKEGFILGMFLLLFIKRRKLVYFSWALVFGYLLLDDAMKLHERLGRLLEIVLGLSPILGLRAEDIGELIAIATTGGMLLILVAVGYYFSDAARKKFSKYNFILLCGLLFFGVFIDMLHQAASKIPLVSGGLGILEDGGEMIVMSLIVWYLLTYGQQSKPVPPGPKEKEASSPLASRLEP